MLIVEDGTLPVGANSYVSIEEASFYHEAGVSADEWAAIDPAEQERLLVTATRLLDATIEWRGYRSYPGQALDWPRVGVLQYNRYVLPANTVPIDVRYATAELALHLKRRPAPTAPGAAPVEEVKLGPISVKMGQATQSASAPLTALPVEVLALIREYGSYSSGRVRMARTVR